MSDCNMRGKGINNTFKKRKTLFWRRVMFGTGLDAMGLTQSQPARWAQVNGVWAVRGGVRGGCVGGAWPR